MKNTITADTLHLMDDGRQRENLDNGSLCILETFYPESGQAKGGMI